MHKVFLIIFFFLSFALSSYAQNNELSKELTEKMNTLKQALISKDSVSLSSLLSDDVTYGHSNGMIQTKAQLIRDVMSQEQDYKSIEASDMNIRMYDNAGVVTMQSKVAMVYSGKPISLNMFITSTWIKINGAWKLVARQSVKLPA